MEIIVKGLTSNKSDFISNFENTQFCSQNEVQQVKLIFKDKASNRFFSMLKKKMLSLGASKEFKKAIGEFIDTCLECRNISADAEKYSQTIQEEADKQEKDPNYEINNESIERVKGEFLNHPQIKALTIEQAKFLKPKNVGQDTKKVEENDSAVYQLDIKKKFPIQMWIVTQVFKQLAQIEANGKYEEVLKQGSEQLGIDFNKMKQFFEVQQKEREEKKMEQEKAGEVKPKNIDQIVEDLLSCKDNASPDTAVKTLAQLLSELVLGGDKKGLSEDSREVIQLEKN
jgi:hypothetical protein